MTRWPEHIPYIFMGLLLAAVIYGLSGCSTTQCVRPVVTLPEPVLPTVMSGELECLPPSVYERLALRDLELHGALRECRAVVEELSE